MRFYLRVDQNLSSNKFSIDPNYRTIRILLSLKWLQYEIERKTYRYHIAAFYIYIYIYTYGFDMYFLQLTYF